MGIIKVMMTAIVLLAFIGGTVFITRWLLERFINFFLQRKVK
jgi:hypothetical protein